MELKIEPHAGRFLNQGNYVYIYIYIYLSIYLSSYLAIYLSIYQKSNISNP